MIWSPHSLLVDLWRICREFLSDVVADTCNPATLEAEHLNGVGSIPVRNPR